MTTAESGYILDGFPRTPTQAAPCWSSWRLNRASRFKLLK